MYNFITFLLFFLIFLINSLIIGAVCDSLNCNSCPEAGNASSCWNNVKDRDNQCGFLVNTKCDVRYSFNDFKGNRCACCPKIICIDGVCFNLNDNLALLKQSCQPFCNLPCNSCPEAKDASVCWNNPADRDKYCGFLEGTFCDSRYSFSNLKEGRCYCCPKEICFLIDCYNFTENVALLKQSCVYPKSKSHANKNYFIVYTLFYSVLNLVFHFRLF